MSEKGGLIGVLLPDLRGGGAERVCIDLAFAFAEKGHEVEFVLMSAVGEFLPEAERNFSVADLGVERIRQLPWALARYLRRRQPDALIANMWPVTSAAVLGGVLSRQSCPMLLVEHTTLSHSYASWGKWHNLLMKWSIAATYPLARCIAAVSQGAAQDLARIAPMPLDKVKVLHNPVAQTSMPDATAHARAEVLWNCRRGPRILSVGSFKDAKNYPLLLSAFARTSRPDARLMLLGQGDNEPALRDLARSLGIAEQVIFPGFHADPSAFYATADLFVLSSDYEGLPTVLIEALSFGLPVVSTDCCSGPAEILDNGRYGLLTPVGDAEALAAAMDKALGMAWDKEALQGRARDFSPDKAAARYLEELDLL